MKLYHYTLGIKLASIFNNGCIKTSPLKPIWPEKPIAWLSTNANYEKSALKMGVMPGGEESKILTMDQMEEFGQGIYRFVFDSKNLNGIIFPWKTLRKKSKINPVIIKRLEYRATAIKSQTSQWFGTLGKDLPIARSILEKCHRCSGGTLKWVEVPMVQSIDTSKVLQVTVTEAKKIGLNLDCTDESWECVS